MMGSYNPADASGIYALLAVVADPKASKENLDALAAASAEQKALVDQAAIDRKAAQDQLDEAKAKLADATKALSSAAQIGADADAVASDLKIEMAKRESDLGVRKAALDKREDDIKVRESDLDERDRDITSRQTALDRAANTQAALDAKIADYDARIAKMKALVS